MFIRFSAAALAVGLVVAAVVATSVNADSPAGGTCESGSCPLACSSGECPISAAVASSMQTLPQLAFVVGDETTHCEVTAGNLAADQGQPIRFAVGDQTYDDKGQAYDALIAQTEAMLVSFTTPTTCAVSGTTQIAGDACGCSVQAGQIAEKVNEAAKQITVSYLVGDEACDCPKTSAAMAKDMGVDRTYVIGEVKTTCPKTARLAYARARYEAAAKAAAEIKLVSTTAMNATPSTN